MIYDPKEGYGEGRDIPGFIAEEVYAIEPNLVVLNSDNTPENIAYNSFHALVIKELQKHKKQLVEQYNFITKHTESLDIIQEDIIRLRAGMNSYINKNLVFKNLNELS